MSDTVLVALIAGAPGILASIFGFLNHILARRSTEHWEKTQEDWHKTQEAIHLLEKNTNSIKDELVAVTRESSRAIGNLEGRAELKAENRGEEEFSG